MTVYSVFEPPARGSDSVAYAERFAFVRDGFSWGAFIFGPFWMLYHRLVLVLVLWIVVVAAITIAARLLAASPGSAQFVMLLLALLVGFEGVTMRRWTMLRRGWRDAGIVVADDREAAERRFFDAWVMADVTSAAPAAPAAGPAHDPTGSARDRHAPDVIGLFPEPGANR
jgi:hypothetical protein